jgi:hypothetical protein
VTNSSRALASDAARRRAHARRLQALLPLAVALFAGAHLAGLIFFLNPRVPVSALALARGALVYGALLSPAALAAHWALALWRRVPVRRLIPWTLTAVAGAGALGDWVHASYWSFYLPAGINVQLIKTALWLTGGALLLFYTALLHSLHARRYGPRSRLFLVLVCCGTVYAMVERRESFGAPRPGPVRPPALLVEGAPHLALVILPTATLDAILPLAEQGRLPFFAALVEGGARARLATLAPTLPLPLEATLATGKLPFRHGLESATYREVGWLAGGEPLRLLPVGVGFARWGLPGARLRAPELADREALPLWEVLARAGRPIFAAGFPPALGGPAAEPAVEERGVPGASPLTGALAAALARDRTTLARARGALAGAGESPPPALLVRLEGFEQASRAAFGAFAAFEFEGARAGRVQRAAAPFAAYLEALDADLAELWRALPEPRLLAVASAYGVSAPSGLARILRDLAGRQRLEGGLGGAPDGLLFLRGEGVRLGVQVPAAGIADVVPTLLYALGMPVARDLDGKVLGAAFEPAWLQRRPLTFLPSYEGLAPARAAALSGP